MALNPKLVAWEHRLHEVLQQVDTLLEDEYGHEWPLHPARPPRGATANAQYDGLFRVTASFTAGFGSKVGRGYVFRVELATLAEIPAEVRKQIDVSAAAALRRLLPEAFPGLDLRVTRDGHVFKIHGDLSLGVA
jgi:hypothetical protein